MAWPKRLNGAGLCADRIFGAKATNRATEIDDKLSTKNVNQFTLGFAMDWFRLAGIRKFVLTLLCVGTSALSAANVVHAQPKPNAQVQKILEDKEISYVDWLLFDGIYTGNVEQVLRAPRSSTNPNTARNFQADHPPLFAALVATSNAAIVSLLIQKGADVNARYIATPSTNMSQLSAAERLILAVRANEQRRYYSPLYYAVAFGNNIKVVEMLLEAGATADSRGGGRDRAFCNLRYRGHSKGFVEARR